ncbi:Maf family protein [Gallibacterium genomosp. 3]|nr:Maf family protein [Gallibacterium genomosp. 3]
MDKKIYLGSNSPRRLQLLQQIGLTVEVLKAEIDETPLAQEKRHH